MCLNACIIHTVLKTLFFCEATSRQVGTTEISDVDLVIKRDIKILYYKDLK